jgi:effector-binding domain-containing protein
MDSHIELIEKEIGHVVEIEENTFVWKMPSVMSKNFDRLTKFASDDEMPYARYVEFDWEEELSKGMLANIVAMFFKKWHFFTGIQTSTQVDESGDLLSHRIEQRRYVKATHYGPYHQVSNTYRHIVEWANEHDLVLDNESIEFYLNDPREVGKEKTETMVLIPVIKSI